MKRTARWQTALLTGLLIAGLGGAWIGFAPVALGGQATYLITRGISMQPGILQGDLVLVRRADHYDIGDVAAYLDPYTHGMILHRIVDLTADGFVFQGDNNSWLDPARLQSSELSGKLWLHWPSAGGWLYGVRPYLPALATTAVVVLLLGGAGGAAAHRRRHGQRRQPQRDKRGETMNPAGTSGQGALLVLGILGGAAALLGFFAFTQPTERTVTEDLPYVQAGSFEYAAAVPAGAVYAADTAVTGETVFRQLARTVSVTFDYQLTTALPHRVDGSKRLTAILGDGGGWNRTLELQSETPFSGDATSVSGELDFDALQALIDGFVAATGVRRQDYTLAIVPEITIAGRLDDQELRGRFAPRLGFRLDALQLQLAPVSAPPGGTAPTPLAPAQPGSVKTARVVPNQLAVMGRPIEVATARPLALASGAVALGGLLLLGLAAVLARRADEPSRIQSQYGPLLLAVHGSNVVGPSRLVLVDTIAALAHLADKSGSLVLHQVRDGVHGYYVPDGDVTYGYEVEQPRQAREPAAAG
jgi:signal peptidase I